MLERSRKIPELAGHDEASSTALLPAARKNDGVQRNSAKSGTYDRLAVFVRSRQS